MSKGDSFDKLFEAHVAAMQQEVELSHPTKGGKAAAKAALFGEMTQNSVVKITARARSAEELASDTGSGLCYAALANGSAILSARLMLFAGGNFSPTPDQIQEVLEVRKPPAPPTPPAGP